MRQKSGPMKEPAEKVVKDCPPNQTLAWMMIVIYPDSDSASASLGCFCVSATCYRRAEYVSVVAIVVAPFELSNIQRQIFATNLVIATHDSALQERPEPIDRLSVNCAIDVLASAMANGAVLF